MSLENLTNEELLSGLHLVCANERRLLAQVLMHLIEVEDRRLHLEVACSSLYDFCIRKLRMSENQSGRRIAAARLIRRFPALLPHIETGELQLTTLLLLARELTSENFEELVTDARGKSKREVELLIAGRAPKPDIPSLVRPIALGARADQLAHSRVSPLSADRYAVQFTADASLQQKIQLARDLSRHGNRLGDLPTIIEKALDLLIAKLRKQRFGETTRPLHKARPSNADHISAKTRREVFERDGERCTFVDGEGTRCEARVLLELDHVHERALGGASDTRNLRVLCEAHNRLNAEKTFGRDHIETRIRERRRHQLIRETE